jgi:hypothetical protein
MTAIMPGNKENDDLSNDGNIINEDCLKSEGIIRINLNNYSIIY